MIIASFIVPECIPLSRTVLINQHPGLIIRAHSSAKGSLCPQCSKRSKSIHSKYSRTFTDLPVSGKEVKVIIEARKFFCNNVKCQRKIFTERFSHQILPHRRCFQRCEEMLQKVGLELGGNKAALMGKVMGYSYSASSILRCIKGIELPVSIVTSGIIGVDDWAYKKGRTYGTIIVDLENRKIIDLLPDREAVTLENWLKVHPEVHTVTRDRASAYALGIKSGAPQAIQVADRYHLVVNLRDAVQRSLHKHGKGIKNCFHSFSTGSDQKDLLVPLFDDILNCSRPVNAERHYKFQQAKELHKQGYSLKAIARQLKAGRKTIRKYIAMEQFKSREVNETHYSTNFSDFQNILLEMYSPDITYLSIFNHVKKLGFNGKYGQFCHRMNQLINDGRTSRSRKSNQLPVLKPVKTWSTSRLSFMALSEGKLNTEDQAFLDFLFSKSPEIKTTAELAQSFKKLVTRKQDGSLEEWLGQAKSSELKAFAKGIKRDFEAVNQAVLTPFSNGQVEGQVNKLKMIKRKMYGRAGFDLLRTMILADSG